MLKYMKQLIYIYKFINDNKYEKYRYGIWLYAK